EVRLLVSCVALLLLELLRFQESPGVERGWISLRELAKERAVARKETGFQERCVHRDVLLRHREAFVDRPYAVADFEADIPQRSDQTLEQPLDVGVRRSREQHENVDVGIRIELATAVAAH